VAVGVTALIAPGSLPAGDQLGWLQVWLWDALVASLLTVGAIVWKARRSETSLLSQPSRRFVLALCPPLIAGALLTPVLLYSGTSGVLPGVWLLLYGTGVVTGGAFSRAHGAGDGDGLHGAGRRGAGRSHRLAGLLLAAGFGGLQHRLRRRDRLEARWLSAAPCHRAGRETGHDEGEPAEGGTPRRWPSTPPPPRRRRSTSTA